MNDFLTGNLGFSKVQAASCLYIKHDQTSNKFVIVALYVDDITLVGDSKLIRNTKDALKAKFQVSDLGLIKKVLGIHVTKDPNNQWIFLDQQDYSEGVLKKFGMEKCNSAPTPALQNIKLTKNMCPTTPEAISAAKKETLDYRAAVCSLLYLTHTHPEISYPVAQVAKFVENPGVQHFQALKGSLDIFKGTNITGYSTNEMRTPSRSCKPILMLIGQDPWITGDRRPVMQ
jgi:hypothetical protein